MLAGNIVKDAEVRHVGGNGTAVSTITIANNQRFKDKDDNWQENTAFVEVELWGALAQRSEEFARKGIPLVVEGTIKENRWRDKEDKFHSRLLVRAEKVHLLNHPEKENQQD